MNSQPSLLATGYFVEYGPQVEGVHDFCGDATALGLLCPTCKKPPLHLLSLDPADPIIAESLRRRVPLICCWTCKSIRETFFYRIGDGQVGLLEWKKGTGERNFPYPKYPRSFPHSKAKLSPLTSTQQQLIRGINTGEILPYEGEARRMGEPHHQVGGTPFLVEGEFRALRCPVCKKDLRFLATVADDNLDPRGFVGNRFVQLVFFYCGGCAIVGGYQASE